MTSLLAFFAEIDWNDVAQAALDTLNHAGLVAGLDRAVGLPLGIVLYLTGQPRLLHAPRLYRLLSFCVNVLRSLPFIILLIVMIPVTTLMTGTSLGVEGTIPPLVAGCAPFFARLVETALREVDHGLVEASWSMGGSTGS
jgi:D-methionine transport system permease protein